jgi:hypothetical protein
VSRTKARISAEESRKIVSLAEFSHFYSLIYFIGFKVNGVVRHSDRQVEPILPVKAGLSLFDKYVRCIFPGGDPQGGETKFVEVNPGK